MRPERLAGGPRLAAALTALLLLPALDGCAGAAGPRQVVLVLLDAARPDRMGAYGYPRGTTPSLDALASEGAVFLNHYAQATTTRASLPSLLYSRYFIPPLFPASAQVPYSAPEDLFRKPDPMSVSLPRALAGAGFHTALISAHTWLREETPFAAQFDEAIDLASRLGSEPGEGYPRARKVVDFALRWIEEHRGEDFFVWLHLMDTHFPHAAGPEARSFLDPAMRDDPLPDRFTAAGGVRDAARPLTLEEKSWLDALYDGSLRATDAEVGRLLDRLRLPDAERIVIVTSDHGEALMESPGRFGHGVRAWETVARVPLILWRSTGGRGVRIGAPSEAVDVAPTILGLLGVAPPGSKVLDGRDLSGALDGGDLPAAPAIVQGGIRSGRWKCLFDRERDVLLAREAPPGAGVSGELYDLESDPEERIDLGPARPEVVAELLRAYRERLLPAWERYSASPAAATPESPFAISARHLRLEPERACTDDDSRIESFFGSGEGWLRFCDPQGDFLIGDAGAGDLRIRVAIPDGAYLVRIGMRGAAAVDLGGPRGASLVAAAPFDPWDYFPWEVESVAVGRVDVRERIFSATIRPGRSDEALLVEYVGFEPESASGAAESREHLERLRSLGYVD